MEQKIKPTILIVTVFLTIFTAPRLVQPCNLASSPSPAPVNGESIAHDANPFRRRNEKAMRGSFPATCHSKCNQCRPCKPVVVFVRTTELEENEYYPQVWRCMCQNKMFSP